MDESTVEITQSEHEKRAAQKAYKLTVERNLRIEAENIEHREKAAEAEIIQNDPELINAGITIRDEFFDENHSFKAMRFVDWILRRHKKDHIASPVNARGGDVIYWYNKKTGIYEQNGIPRIEQLLQDILDDDCTKPRQNEVIHQIRVATYVNQEQFFHQNPAHIILENGVYNRESGQFMAHDSRYRALTKIPHRYNMEAKCPNIVKTLVEIAGRDIATIQEGLGYQLYRLYPIHKVALFIGAGKNGKSQILELIKRLVGKENTSSVSLFELTSDKFAASELYGKHSNIAPDVGSEELKYTGRFKAMTGEDTVRAQEKYGQPFSFLNYAKMNFSCNQVPPSPDNSDAFYRRFLCFKFRKRFLDRFEVEANPMLQNDPDVIPKIPRIIDKVCTVEEMEGLVVWALKGLSRLLLNVEFSNSQSTEEIREYYTMMSNPIVAFVSNNLEEDLEAYESVDRVYNYYVKWCRENGFVAEIKSQFGAKISGEISFQKQRLRIGDVRVYCYVGIRLVHSGPSGPRSNNLSRGKLQEYFLEEGVNHPDHPDHPDQAPNMSEDITPNELDLVRKAESILKLNKGHMDQRDFWNSLEKRGHRERDVSQILR
ncbi:hypothetical protein E4H04_12620, partial [Candidatus Bathyarchaeota archaeon]